MSTDEDTFRLIISNENRILFDVGRLIGSMEFYNLRNMVSKLECDYPGFEEIFDRRGFKLTDYRRDIFKEIKEKTENGELSALRIIAPFGFGKTVILEEIKRRFQVDMYKFIDKKIKSIFLALNNIHTRTDLIYKILSQFFEIDKNLTVSSFYSTIESIEGIDKEISLEEFLLDYNLLDNSDKYRKFDEFLYNIKNKTIIKIISLISSEIENKNNVTIIFLIDEFEAVSRVENFHPSYLGLLSLILRRCVSTLKEDSNWRCILTDTRTVRFASDGTAQTYDALLYLLESSQFSQIVDKEIGESDISDRLKQNEFTYSVNMKPEQAIKFAKDILEFYISNLVKIDNCEKWHEKLEQNSIFPLDNSLLELFGHCLNQFKETDSILSFRSLLIMIGDTLRYYSLKGNDFLKSTFTPLTPKFFWENNQEILALKDGNILSEFNGIRPIIQTNRIVNFIMDLVNGNDLRLALKSILKQSLEFGLKKVENKDIVEINIIEVIKSLHLDFDSKNIINIKNEFTEIFSKNEYINFENDRFYIMISKIENEFLIKERESGKLIEVLKNLLNTEFNGNKVISCSFFNLLKYTQMNKSNITIEKNYIFDDSNYKKSWSPGIYIFEDINQKSVIQNLVDKSGFSFGICIEGIWNSDWPKEENIILPKDLTLKENEVIKIIHTKIQEELIDPEKLQKQNEVYQNLSKIMKIWYNDPSYKIHMRNDISENGYIHLLLFYILPLVAKEEEFKTEHHYDILKNSLWSFIINELAELPKEFEYIYLKNRIDIEFIEKKNLIYLSKIILKKGIGANLDYKKIEDLKSINLDFNDAFLKTYRLKSLWNENFLQKDLQNLKSKKNLNSILNDNGIFKELIELPKKLSNAIEKIRSQLSEFKGILPEDIAEIIFSEKRFQYLTDYARILCIFIGLLCVKYDYGIILLEKDNLVLYSKEKKFSDKNTLIKDFESYLLINIGLNYTDDQLVINRSHFHNITEVKKINTIIEAYEITNFSKNLNNEIKIKIKSLNLQKSFEDLNKLMKELKYLQSSKDNPILIDCLDILESLLHVIKDEISKDNFLLLPFFIQLNTFFINLSFCLKYNFKAIILNKKIELLNKYTTENQIPTIKDDLLNDILKNINKNLKNLDNIIDDIKRIIIKEIEKSYENNGILDIKYIRNYYSKLLPQINIPDQIKKLDFHQKDQVINEHFDKAKISISIKIDDIESKLLNLFEIAPFSIKKKIQNILSEINSLNIILEEIKLNDQFKHFNSNLDIFFENVAIDLPEIISQINLKKTDLEILEILRKNNFEFNQILLEITQKNLIDLINTYEMSEKEKKKILKLLYLVKKLGIKLTIKFNGD